MADESRDSQDSETSSTSSWILLSNEEAAADIASVVNQEEFFREVLQNLNESDIKNNQSSDIESDGISVISENEFLQNRGRSDDEEASTSSDEEKIDNTDESFINLEQMSEILDKYANPVFKQTEIEETSCLDDECNDDSEVCDEITAEFKGSHREEVHTSAIVVSKSETDKSIANCLSKLTEKYDYKIMLTWPSLLCTSVVIFAVLIFPCFLSSDEKTSSVEKSNLDQYDMKILSDKNNINEDLLVYCKEIHHDDIHQDYNVKKCVKRILKRRTISLKNEILQSSQLDGEMYRDLHEGNSFSNQDIKRDYDGSENDVKKYHHQKYRKKYAKINQYNLASKHCYGDEKHCLQNQKDMLFDANNVADDHNNVMNTQEYFYKRSVSYSDKDKKEKHQKLMKNEFNSKEDRFESTQKIKKELKDLEINLRIKENSLKEKEQKLRAWENVLKQKERKLKTEMNIFKKESARKKGEFIEKSQDYKYWKIEADKSKVNKFREKKEELDRFSKKWHKSHKLKDMKINKYVDKDVIFRETFPNQIFQFVEKDEVLEEKLTELGGNSNIDLNSSIYLKLQNSPQKNFTGVDGFSVTGEWYLNLLQGRQDIRKREDKAVWWFDRAEYRKNRRNKAYWYFQYMFNRENLRYRPRSI